RYRQPLSKARLCLLYNRKAKLIFNKPQIAPTPGQFAVFYNRNACLGAGKIVKKL
ncbi:tRNA 2-thiouridine(34) synthase MnmA, partial [bacterium]|nr:tRNA 2-thiouridine(34) synthase MnmA [bacterium]